MNTGLQKIVINIQYVEILADKVYIEYTDRNSDYISFSKANTLIKESPKELIRYTCVDNQRAIDFVNSVAKRTTVFKDGYSYLKKREINNV